MRPLYVDISGTTDAKGNASIPVALPRMTGRWHNAKFSLGMSGPGEWAVLVNGRPYTYGRGRRVTLGPELIQDGETATVSVIGGPAKVAIDGTATGVSGTPDEIMATYTPSPNTIALDTAAPMAVIGTIQTVGNGDVVSATFPVPPGTLGVAYIVRSQAGDAFPNTVQIKGDVTNDTYVLVTAAGGGAISFASVPGKWLVPDVNAICSVTSQTGPGLPAFVEFVALSYVGITTVSKQPGSAPFDITISQTIPPLWLAPTAGIVAFNLGFTVTGITHVVPASGGLTVYLFNINGELNTTGAVAGTWQDTAGNEIDTINATAVAGHRSTNWSGAPLPVGRGLDFNVTNAVGGSSVTYGGGVAYSQG